MAAVTICSDFGAHIVQNAGLDDSQLDQDCQEKYEQPQNRSRKEWQRIRSLDGVTDSIDMNLSKLQEIGEDRGAWCAAVHEITKSRTQLSD